MGDLLQLIPLLILGSVAGLIGGVFFLVNKRFARSLCGISIPLGTGVLLAISLTDLLPESVELLDKTAYLVVLGVFVVLFIIERFFFHLHHHEDSVKSAAPMVIFGDTIHNFLDGASIAAAFMVDPKLGLTVAIATFLHETPHEIADFGILLSAGWKDSRVFMANFWSALATFPGALVAYYFSSTFENTEGYFLAIAAGLFLYIAATDFLPEVGHDHGKFSIKEVVFLLLGIGLVLGSNFLI